MSGPFVKKNKFKGSKVTKMKKRNLLFSKERSVTKVTKWKLSWSEVKFSVSQEELTMNLFMTEKGGKMKNVVFNS